jgi:hypothetical protein
MELPSLAATDLHDAASLVSSPPVASVEMNMAALVSMGAGDDMSMARSVPIPAATPRVGTLLMTLPAADVASERAALPPVPEGTPAAMSMQVVAGLMPSVSAHAELGPPLPEAMPPADVAMQLSHTDLAASTSDRVLVAPELPAQPSESMAHTLAAIVPLARAAERNVPVPMPTLVPYIAELQVPSLVITGATGKGVLVVPPPSAGVARTNIDAVAAMMTDVPPSTGEHESSPAGPPTALPIRKKVKKQLSLRDRKAARKAGRARTDRLDDSSLFNPDECRFAALVAKLDEVAPGLDESRVSEGAAASRTHRRKTPSKRR